MKNNSDPPLIQALETFIGTANRLLEAAAIVPELPPFELPPPQTFPVNVPEIDITEEMLKRAGKKREDLTAADLVILAQIERDSSSYLKTARPFVRPVAEGEQNTLANSSTA